MVSHMYASMACVGLFCDQLDGWIGFIIGSIEIFAGCELGIDLIWTQFLDTGTHACTVYGSP